MKDYTRYIILLSLLLALIIGVAGFCVLFKSCGIQNKSLNADTLAYKNTMVSSPTSSSTALIPTRPQQIDGIMTLPIAEISSTSFPGIPTTLLSAGTGTTTLTKNTPFNDVLIAETGSPFASLRNARYSMWPYPGEIRFKEIYLVLPDVYEPIFPGYSNNQFIVSSDGTKQVKLYLRNTRSTDIGADTEVYIQTPIQTDEADHPLMQIDVSASGATYSMVAKGEEVLIEITYNKSPSLSQDRLTYAHNALFSAIEQMEIIW